MSHHLRASLLLTIAVALTVALNVLNQPAPVPAEQHDREIRARMVLYYLAFKGSESGSHAALKKFLKNTVESLDYDRGVVKTAALIAGVEGDETYANALLACLPEEDPHLHMIDFALGYGGYLPEEWETYVSSNWFGLRLSSLIYQRLGFEAVSSDYLPILRQMENNASSYGIFLSLFYIAGMVGLGLLISMAFSARFFKKYGYPYFLLGRLRMPRPKLYELSSFMLFAALFMGGLAGMLPNSLAMVYKLAFFYLGVVIIGLLVIRHFVFDGKDVNKIAKILGLHNQKMRVFLMFHILGGLLMCIGMYLIINQTQSYFWPYDRLMQLDVPAIMAHPLHATLFVAISCVIAPIFEEIMYRGLIFRGALSTSPPWVAVLFSAFLFALPHQLPSWPVTFVLGIVLALIYYRTANLLVCIWTHAAWNILVLVLSMSHISL